jgi:flagella basal body P-ring formation protein FlgA
MLRTIAILSLVTLSTAAGAQVTGALAPTTPVLKRNVVVAGELVRIGDLVENTGAAANVAIFRAPDLGSTGTVPVERVLDAVRAHAVIGVDTRGATEVSVTRPSQAISPQDFERRIAQALAGRNGLGAAANVTVTFDRIVRTLHLDPQAELQISRLRYEPRTNRFDAEFEMSAGPAARRPVIRLTGTAVETVEIATVVRPFERGDVLKASDVVVERRPKAEVTGNFVATADRAVGFAARRPLRAGQTLREGDLMRAEVVHRNDAVTIVYEAPGIVLTLRGKALESGAEGDSVSVLNVQSKRTVHGTVIGPGRIQVTAATPHVTGTVVASPASETPGAQRRGLE